MAVHAVVAVLRSKGEVEAPGRGEAELQGGQGRLLVLTGELLEVPLDTIAFMADLDESADAEAEWDEHGRRLYCVGGAGGAGLQQALTPLLEAHGAH